MTRYSAPAADRAYELLTGEHPFPGLTPGEQFVRRLTEPLPPLTALKSMLGEAHAASPGLHVVAALRIIGAGLLPPTLGWEREASERLRPVVQPMKMPLERLLINANSPGGGAASLVLQKAPTQ